MRSSRTPSNWLQLSPSGRTALALLALLLSALPARAGEASEVLAEGSGASRIEGIWGVTVTLRDCATGNPIGPPFRSLLTYATGGTIDESTGALGFAPGQRTTGHGVWQRLHGRTYSQRTIALILFETPPQPPSPGFLAGWQVIDHTVTLASRDYLTSEGTTEFYDTQGVLYRSGCSTAVGERFR